ncbi:MFS transporter [Bifidobacterium sp.]|jgi:DHA3 family macrolide efflux protein-like MFS transporter|uniref:MFS transporter n=1 Tax=Bifidobacterium sp. TaxID=41200 RepID=UPI0025C1B1BD|nr:MFS transporter [Bifidobacterium sp.]MCI1634641.1 MFS transporter [Bifidobacterium sp.]
MKKLMLPKTGWRRNTSFLLSGQFISIFGSSLVQYAITWDLAIRTNSGIVAMLGFAFANVPQALMSIFGGWLADRFPRGALINIPDMVTAMFSIGLAVGYATNHASVMLVYTVLFVRSLAAGVQSPAVDSYLPSLTPTSHLMRVNSINGILQSGITILAPVLSAALIGTFRMQSILIVDAITALVGISLLLLIREAPAPLINAGDRKVQRPSIMSDIREGLTYCRHHPIVGRTMVVFAICFILCVAPIGMNPIFVNRNFTNESLNLAWMTLRTATDKLALLELMYGVGAIAGGLIMTVWGGFHRRFTSMGVAMSGLASANILMGFSASSMVDSVWIFALSYTVTGFVAPLLLAPASTLIQETVEASMLGRVFGLLNAVRTLSLPLGLSIIGPLADLIPIEWVYIGAGLLALPVALWIMFTSAERG